MWSFIGERWAGVKTQIYKAPQVKYIRKWKISYKICYLRSMYNSEHACLISSLVKIIKLSETFLFLVILKLSLAHCSQQTQHPG